MSIYRKDSINNPFYFFFVLFTNPGTYTCTEGGELMLFVFEQSKVIILGFNNISLYLANNLSHNKDVVIFYYQEIEHTRLDEVDVIMERVDSSLLKSFKKYQIDKDTIFISFTENNELNLFAAGLAKKLGAEKAIAMVTEMDYPDIDYGIDLVFNPHQIVVDKINTIIKDTRLVNIENLIPGKINLTNIKVNNNDSFSYVKLKNIEMDDGLIIAVKREEKMILPGPETQFFPGDILFILYKKGIYSWLKAINKNKLVKKKIAIYGGGKSAEHIINCWKSIFDSIIIIEPDLNKCDSLATRLEKPLILHGEGTELQLLREEGIGKKSIFISCSEYDPQNLLSSFSALKLGCNEVLTLINNPVYLDISELLNLNEIIFVPELVSDYIHTYIKTGLKLDKYILGSQIYTGQIRIKSRYKIADKKVKEINLPEGILIGVIIRGNNIILPGGEDEIKQEDKLIIFFKKELESRLNDIF